MADTVTFQSATPATPPDATIIATDDAGIAGQVQIIKLAISADGSATPIPADASGLKIKADSLPLPTGAATSALQTQPGVDIGDVTVNNAAGVSAVNVQDGGNSLTVDNGGTFAVQDAAAEASLSVLDDWDESDRAKVNLIVGQAGVQGGSGVVTALTQRVVLATDVALPTGNNNVGDVDIASIAAGDNNIGNVDIVTMPAVTNAGTFVVQENGAALTSLQLIDDSVITDDITTFTPGTSKGLAIAAVVDDDSTDTADEGDMVLVRATKERKLRVVSALDSAAMQSGNDQVTPKFVSIAASASGDNTLVSGVASKKIRVLSYVLMSNGTVNAKFQSSTGGDITGLLYLVANTGASSGFSPVGHFETVAGEDLQLNLSGAIAVGGHLTYIEVD